MKKLEEVLEMRTLVKLKEEMNEIEELGDETCGI